MKILEYKIEGMGKEFIQNLLQLKSGESLKIENFPDRETLLKFSNNMICPQKIRYKKLGQEKIYEDYVTIIHQRNLTFTMMKL